MYSLRIMACSHSISPSSDIDSVMISDGYHRIAELQQAWICWHEYCVFHQTDEYETHTAGVLGVGRWDTVLVVRGIDKEFEEESSTAESLTCDIMPVRAALAIPVPVRGLARPIARS
ncbi:hypothetical protein PAXRUDRAFT_757949 [Paxillus rubicundulus Ve08.2h10]|uniref:Uncharacterized protein n=1 Tax=Paxillus rubicundulus Ve08.2h10 TaxID=930991 RepID=A0A0D0DU80_9AGAM|nr:hypothetical protein PAXRUDRAFT_757949 [Paxillus rubicundulus Ve08.2h10]